VGRTGTYIVIDTQLKRIAKRKTVDVFGNVQKLRNQRLLMVQVEDQYIFIHNVLLEAINSGDTEIQVEDFTEQMREIMDVNPETGKRFVWKSLVSVMYNKLSIYSYSQ
jgi:hypothetical protein